MDVDFDGGQKVIFQTGSFTGYRPLFELGSGYLSATEALRQPLCGNEEGWGPLSPFRYDFTPCFIDVWVASVAAFGIVAGLVAVWWLLKKKTPAPVAKDWHFWVKQVRLGASEGPCLSRLTLCHR
jgi:ATP-binding cassette subfamily C (CFTR/MRP) protein 1